MTSCTAPQRQWQHRFDSVALADRLEQAIVRDTVDDATAGFIASRDFFFLGTVDGSGMPSVSYEGGDVGLVSVLDPRTLAFPHHDGNGMFLSMGNISDSHKIAMLFIDLETPNRIRVQATATVSDDDELLARYPGATLIARATIDAVFHNCGRYIHRHSRDALSKYVPDAAGQAPCPAWKRIDGLQDVLVPADRGRAGPEGGTITFGDDVEELAAGDS